MKIPKGIKQQKFAKFSSYNNQSKNNQTVKVMRPAEIDLNVQKVEFQEELNNLTPFIVKFYE